MFTLSKFEFINECILVNALGISKRISLNSFIIGGKIKIAEVRNMNVKRIKTNIRDNGLGIFNNLLNWLHRLQIIFAKTKEHIISKKKSLKLQNIRKKNATTSNLKKRELFNLFWTIYFSEYPKPFDLA